jgi:hypothetical protein
VAFSFFKKEAMGVKDHKTNGCNKPDFRNCLVIVKISSEIFKDNAIFTLAIEKHGRL